MSDIQHVDLTDPYLHPPGTHATQHENGGADEVALDASQITSGVVATARLGSGAVGSGLKALYDDGTYKTVTATPAYTLVDHFIFGNTSSGAYGEFGWLTGGTGTAPSYPGGEAGHPGVVMKSTGVTGSQYGGLYAQNGSASILPADNFDITFVFKISTTTDSLVRMGLANPGTNNPPTNGIYLESLATDTDWYGVTRAASSQTRTSSVVAAKATGWATARVWRSDASTISFAINGGTAQTLTATIPTATLTPFFCLGNAATAANKDLSMDKVTLTFT